MLSGRKLHCYNTATVSRKGKLSEAIGVAIGAIGVLSELMYIGVYAVVDMGFLYVEHSWIQAVSFLIQRGLVYMHKPHNTCYIAHSIHIQWLCALNRNS